MKYINVARKFGPAAVVLAASASTANAALDFTDITADIDASLAPILAVISAAAVVKAGPGLAKWGYNKIIGWFR